MTDQTPEQCIDANIDKILRAAGSAFRHYTLPAAIEGMRKAMDEVMAESYRRGINDCVDQLTREGKLK